VGFFSRLLVPRSVRRAAHPVRTVKRAATPKTVKKVQRSMHPIDNTIYSMERTVSTAIRSGGRSTSNGPARAQPGTWPGRFTDAWFKANVRRISKDDAWLSSLLVELDRRGWSASDIQQRVAPYAGGRL